MKDGSRSILGIVVKLHRLKNNHVAISAPVMDGKRIWLASASFDGHVGLCALDADGDAEGKVMTLLPGHLNDVGNVAFSAPMADGTRLWLASASEDGHVGLCALDAESGAAGKAMTRLPGHSGWVNHVAISAPVMDGKRVWLASASSDGHVGLCALDAAGDAEGKVMTLLPGHSGTVNHVAFSAPIMDGMRLWLASASNDGHVGLCKLDADGSASGKVMKLPYTPLDIFGAVKQVACSALDDGWQTSLQIACAWDSGHLGQFHYDIGETFGMSGGWYGPTMLTTYSGSLNHVAFSASVAESGYLWLASAWADGRVGLCVLGANHVYESGFNLPGYGYSVQHVALSWPVVDGKRLWLACASYDHDVGLCALDADGSVASKTITRLPGWLISLAAKWNRSQGKATAAHLRGHSSGVNHVVFSAPVLGGKRLWLASGSTDHHVGLCALDAAGDAEGKVMTLLPGHSGTVNHVVFSAPVVDGKRLWLASASSDGHVGLCELDANGGAAGEVMRLLPGHSDRVNHVAFSIPVMDGTRLWLASASEDGHVGLCALDAGGDAISKGFTLLPGWLISLVLRSYRGRIAGEVVTWLPVARSVHYVAFSTPVAEGQRLWLACASSADYVGLCALDAAGDAASKTMTQLPGHSDAINHVAFSGPVAAGKRLWLASASSDRHVGLCVLEAEGGAVGKAMTLLPGHSGEVIQVSFSTSTRAGQVLLASATANEIILWRILGPLVPDCLLVARASFVATGERIHEIRWSDDNRLLYIAGSRGNVPVNLTLIIPPHLLDADTPRCLN